MIFVTLALALTGNLVFVGDSLMAQVGQRAPANTVVHAKSGSGLANPKLRDWSKVTFSTNDTVVFLKKKLDNSTILILTPT